MKKDLNNLFYLSGQEEEPNHYPQDFPSKYYDKDTWRRKEYFETFWKYYPHDMILAMEIIKKVWVNHALSMPIRVPFKKSGELTEEYVLSKCVDVCPMCGKNMWYGRCVNGIFDPEAKPSIDRLVPGSKGGKYIDGNVWIVCKKCNTYKNDQDLPDQMRRGADAWEKEIMISEVFQREKSPLLEFYT
jgi:hypothetical protein